MADSEPRTPSRAWQEVAAIEDSDDALAVAELLDDAPSELLGSLAGAVAARALGVLLQGGSPGVVDQIVGHLRSAWPRASSDREAIPPDGSGLLAVSTLLTCLGARTSNSQVEAPPDVARAWASRAVARPELLDGPARHDWALACAAHGLDDLVEELLDARASTRGTTLPAVALARSVVAAAGGGATDLAARASDDWMEFVATFPAAYSEGSLPLTSLLHAGWAIEVRLGGRRPEQVLVALARATGLQVG